MSMRTNEVFSSKYVVLLFITNRGQGWLHPSTADDTQ